MKILELMFSLKGTLNRKQYFFAYLGLGFFTFFLIIIFSYYFNIDLKELKQTENINKMLLLYIFINIVLFYPSIVLDYKRIKDTNLNIVIFYILIFLSLGTLVYFILSYFNIIEYNDYTEKIIGSSSFIVNLLLFLSKSKHYDNNNTLNNYIKSSFINNDEIKFLPVNKTKFILLSITTLGIYNFYWFYKNFKYIKVNFEDSKNTWPFFRALFSPITSYFLFKKIFYGEKKDYALAIGSLYFLLIVLGNNSHYILSTIGLFSGLSLLPVVNYINEINNYKENEKLKLSKSYGFNYKNIIVLIFSIPIFIYLFLVSSYILLIGNIKGNDLWFWQKSHLENIINGDKVEYFYTVHPYDFREIGVIIGEKSILFYSRDDEVIKKIYYSDLKSIKKEDNIIFLEPKDEKINGFYISLDIGYNYQKIIDYLDSKISKVN